MNERTIIILFLLLIANPVKAINPTEYSDVLKLCASTYPSANKESVEARSACVETYFYHKRNDEAYKREMTQRCKSMGGGKDCEGRY